MNVFQIVALSLLAFLFLGSMVTAIRGRGSRRVALFWAMIWLAAGVAIAAPNITRELARPLGIQRGADLVFYCAILGMIIGFFMIYVRIRRIESTLTKLTRHLALQNPMPPKENSEFRIQNSE